MSGMMNTDSTNSGSTTNVLDVTVTGAAGRIAYALIPLICSGKVFGPDVFVNLKLLDIEFAAERLKGVAMEIEDCCYPLVNSLVATIDSREAFTNCQVAILLGGFPRQQGMERKDLIAKNARGMLTQAQALENYASSDVKVLVVANPANTNALVAMEEAPKIPRQNFTALTRLDQERCRYFVSKYVNEARKEASLYSDFPPTRATDIKGVAIWGNHSSTQVPYIDQAIVNFGSDSTSRTSVSVKDILFHHPLNKEKQGKAEDELTRCVQKRGADIINAQGASSGMSAADAIAKHLHDWLSPGESDNEEFLSMSIISDGNTYGVPNGLNFSFPCRRLSSGVIEIVNGLTISDSVQPMLDSTVAELLQERTDARNAFSVNINKDSKL